MRYLYACYRGEECLGVMTAEEWAELLGCKPSSVRWYATPACHRRLDGSKHGRQFYRVEDEEEG